MIEQKLIIKFAKDVFHKEVNRLITNGWRMCPESLSVACSQSEIHHTFAYAVIVERP